MFNRLVKLPWEGFISSGFLHRPVRVGGDTRDAIAGIGLCPAPIPLFRIDPTRSEFVSPHSFQARGRHGLFSDSYRLIRVGANNFAAGDGAKRSPHASVY